MLLLSGTMRSMKNIYVYIWFIEVKHHLTFIILLANSADNKSMIFYLFFQKKNRIWHFMQIVSIGDNLHEMPNPVFWGKKKKKKKKKIFQYVIYWKFYLAC